MKAKKMTLLGLFVCTSIFSQEYVDPPSSSTRSHVPVISDAAMEECVKLYNEAEWLGEKLEKIVVDSYNQESVDSYNEKIKEISIMTDAFNQECAGKQSQSAYDAAKKLNQQTR
jgi:formyltetrahydrofolate synthetase